jgi:hypothetical protein
MRGLGFVAAFVLAAGLIGAGCKSTHEEGVKSNMRTQWTDVMADTKTTTDAAKAVLMEEGLKDVGAESTNMDGKASGKMADGTKITASVEKKGDNKSQVSVNVGTMGSPTRGAELAKKIKMRAEGNRM